MNIIVTGGTSGLGCEIVKSLAGINGSKILFTFCHDEVKKNQLLQEYENVDAVKVDYSDPGSVSSFVSDIKNINPDILINNTYVGNPQGTYFHKTTSKDFHNSFIRNILPTIEITQAAISVFRKKKFGKIITILTAYLIDNPPMGFSIYTAEKAYLKQLSVCWSRENSRFNISSNCILPEYMNTGFGNSDDRTVEMIRDNHPLHELLSPAEVAEMVSFLCVASQQINGAMIPINAAQHIMQ